MLLVISACTYNIKWKGNMRLINDNMRLTTPTNIWVWQRAIMITLEPLRLLQGQH